MFELLPKYVRDWLWVNAWKFPNVIGFSEAVLPRERRNRFLLDKPVIRFYVSQKVSPFSLRYEDVIPAWITIRRWLRKYSFDVDVVDIGLVEALVDKTVNFRPVELGVSVGNEKITAGSLGMLYKLLDDIVAGSNAHVVTPNAGWSVEDVLKSNYVNILQRGAHHGGKVPDDVVGEYLWHQQIYPLNGIPSDCNIANGVASSLNKLSGLLGRQSRFKSFVPTVNTIDFGIYKPSVEHILKVADDSIDLMKMFFGHLYAGSASSGVLCKVSEILKSRPDLKPFNDNWGDVKVGDRVKGCSFWCNYETDVIDVNGVLNVNYGDFLAPFQNCVVVKNEDVIKGGWSGSGWWKV